MGERIVPALPGCAATEDIGRTAWPTATGRICWPVARDTPATGGPKLPPLRTVPCGGSGVVFAITGNVRCEGSATLAMGRVKWFSGTATQAGWW
jgi:hypothetical protein